MCHGADRTWSCQQVLSHASEPRHEWQAAWDGTNYMVKAKDGVVDSLNRTLQRIGTLRHLALLHRDAIEKLQEDGDEDPHDKFLQVPSPRWLPLLRKCSTCPLR